MKKKIDPKPKKKSNGVKGAKFVPLKPESKQRLKQSALSKGRVSAGTRPFKSSGEQNWAKKQHANAVGMFNNPYQEPLKGRIGVSDKVADAHSAVSKFNKKKK